MQPISKSRRNAPALRLLKAQSGFSLVELLAAAAIMGIGVLITAQFMADSNKAQNALNQKVEATNYSSMFSDWIKSVDVCSKLELVGAALPSDADICRYATSGVECQVLQGTKGQGFCDPFAVASAPTATASPYATSTPSATSSPTASSSSKSSCPKPFAQIQPTSLSSRVPASGSQVSIQSLRILPEDVEKFSDTEYRMPIRLQMKRSTKKGEGEFGGQMSPLLVANVFIKLDGTAGRKIASCSVTPLVVPSATPSDAPSTSMRCAPGQLQTGTDENGAICAPEVPCTAGQQIVMDDNGNWSCAVMNFNNSAFTEVCYGECRI